MPRGCGVAVGAGAGSRAVDAGRERIGRGRGGGKGRRGDGAAREGCGAASFPLPLLWIFPLFRHIFAVNGRICRMDTIGNLKTYLFFLPVLIAVVVAWHCRMASSMNSALYLWVS